MKLKKIFYFFFLFQTFLITPYLKGTLDTLGKQLMNEGLTPSLIKNIVQYAQDNLPSLDTSELEKIAIEEQYGYKSANLTLMIELLPRIPLEHLAGIAIKIPTFVKIPSKEIINLLTAYDCNLPQRWQELITKHYHTPEVYAQAFTSKCFSEVFLTDVKQLHDEIIRLFSTINPVDLLQKFSPRVIQDIEEFVQKTAQDTKKIMVRSTGKEDTDSLANAGGNESISNVEPTKEGVMKAIGRVVASYIGQKSLKQRLCCQDSSLFSDSPFTPILLQEMIGEKSKSSDELIPRCGVMFTEDPEGHLSTPSNRAKTSGISVIQASYGHNEGVVNSLVAVDTYYVDTSGHIYSIITEKSSRIIPLSTEGLERIENNLAIAQKNALSFKQIVTLKACAIFLEHYYQKPMDVEYVFLGETLYIVQARPLVYRESHIQPCYFTNLKKFPHAIAGASIGVAGGSLRIITHPDQCIIEETLGKALNIYQNTKKTPNPDAIECIIIGTMAPATSHEATTFRGELKPVLYLDNITYIKQILEAGNHLVIDPQQNSIIVWTQPAEQPLSELQAIITSKDQALHQSNPFVSFGWSKYPLPNRLSLGILDSKHLKKINEIFSSPEMLAHNLEAFPYDKSVLTTCIEQHFSIRRIIDALTHARTTEEANSYFRFLFNHIIKTYKKYQSTQLFKLPDLSKQLKMITLHVFCCMEQVNMLLNNGCEKIQQLYPLKFLEIILLSQQRNVIQGYSYTSLIAKLKQLAAASEELALEPSEDQQQEHQRATIYTSFAEYALTKELANSWKHFIKIMFSLNGEKRSLGKSNKSLFSHLMRDIAINDMLPLWLNYLFSAQVQSNTDTKIIMENLISDYLKAKDFLNLIKEKEKNIKQINLEALADPKTFTKTWSDFTNLYEYFISPMFIEAFQEQQQFGKLYALGIMERFVAQFDLGIKTVIGSPLYKTNVTTDEEIKSINNKMFTVKLMLKDYLTLLKRWFSLLSIETQIFAKDGFEWLDHFLEERPIDNNKTLFATQAFNVNIAGYFLFLSSDLTPSGTRLKHFSQMETMEDCFTFIHQTLLNLFGTLLKDTISEESILLPDFFDIIKNEIKKKIQLVDWEKAHSIEIEGRIEQATSPEQRASIISIQPFLTGITCKENKIIYSFNIPLRSHSALIFLEYNRKNKILSIELGFSGANELSRWNRACDFAQLLASLFQCTFIPSANMNKINEINNCSFIWRFSTTEPSPAFHQFNHILKAILQITLDVDVQNVQYSEEIFDETLQKCGFEYSDNFLIRVAQIIVDHSLKNNRIHWLLLPAIKKLSLVDSTMIDDHLKEHLLVLLDKCMNHVDYQRNSQRFLNKITDTRLLPSYLTLTLASHLIKISMLPKHLHSEIALLCKDNIQTALANPDTIPHQELTLGVEILMQLIQEKPLDDTVVKVIKELAAMHQPKKKKRAKKDSLEEESFMPDIPSPTKKRIAKKKAKGEPTTPKEQLNGKISELLTISGLFETV